MKINTLLPGNQPKLDEAFVQTAVSILDTDFSMLDILPMSAKKELLPHLALMFGVDITGLDEKSARLYIQNALEIHRYKGTVYAVKKAIDTMFDDAVLYEWFDRDLADGLFDVEVTVKADPTKVYSPQQFRKAKEIIDRAKNVRSHLNSFDISMPLMFGKIEKSEASTFHIALDENCIVSHDMFSDVAVSSNSTFELESDVKCNPNHLVSQDYTFVGGAMWMF